MLIDVGRIIAGKYRLVRLLGRGSMGEVWAAHHETLGDHVAMKLLNASPEDEEALEGPKQASARFQFEAQLAAKFSRKTRHIVRVTDHGREDDLDYLVMELLDGETLENRLAREHRLPVPLVAELVRQVARALTAAHDEGVAHRDLKPANVFLTTDEDGRTVAKLLDFGIARSIHAHRVRGAFATAKGLVFGTPSYMSPEQARGASSLDHRCDLWALATIAYECATGDFPVRGESADELLRNLCAGRIVPIVEHDPQLAALGPFFDRAFHESVDDRYQTSTELASAFERASGAAPQREPSSPSLAEVAPPVTEELPRRTTSRQRALVAAGAGMVVIGTILAWRALSSSTAAPAPQGAPAQAAHPVNGTSASAAPSAALAPSASALTPAVPVSALPRAPGAVTATASPGAPGRGVAVSSTSSPSPAPTPTTAAPTPTPGRKDRSEVF